MFVYLMKSLLPNVFHKSPQIRITWGQNILRKMCLLNNILIQCIQQVYSIVWKGTDMDTAMGLY